MANNFLHKISKELLSKYKEDLSQILVVLPSRRSSLFLTKELATLISRPIWLPTLYTIDDFLFEVNKLKNANSLELFFSFYQAYKKNIPNGHNLERCYNWASTLLEDFNEADKSHANHSDLFGYLSDLKRIENWYLDIGSHKEEAQDYLNFFNKLNNIYQDLIKKLLSNKTAYTGLAQRLVADDLGLLQDWLKKNNKKRIIFIGLDALTKSQEKIIDYLLKNNLCDIHWDGDAYFINNLQQDSGKFLRKYKKKWPKTINNIGDEFLMQKKEINIIGATKNISQAKLLGHLLKQKAYSSSQLKKVAIILPNENLLLSVLESIPKNVKDINVTMGYKLSHHPIISIFNDIANLHINKRSVNINKNIKAPHYLKSDILKLLRNPYFKLLLDSFDQELCSHLFNRLKNTGFSYMPCDEITQIITNNTQRLIKNIFSKSIETGLDLNNLFISLIKQLLESLGTDDTISMIEHECLFTIEEQVLLCNKFLDNVKESISIKLFSKFFKKVIKSVKLNFSGEPLRGIQIMGLLESRTIDFDEVFILSANESELPPNPNHTSFIPFDAKSKFGIRTDLDIDAMNANTFFNLIKRPKQTHIIYNQDLSSFSSKERSRYINQLLYEVRTQPSTSITINHQNLTDTFSLEKSNISSTASQKDDFVFDKLKLIAQNGFSPSTINLYSYCKKQFYFEKILGVSKKEDFENELDKAMVGSIMHRVLYKLYFPYIDQLLNNIIIKKINKSIDNELLDALKHYQIKSAERGKNLLAIEAIRNIIQNFISHEELLIRGGNQIVIKHLEYEVQPHKLNLSKLKGVNLYLKGTIDRVDIYNNTYRIIDYKTGLVEDSDLKTIDLGDLQSKPKVLQLLLYAWLLQKKKETKNIPVLAGVINLRARRFDFQKCIVNKQSNIEVGILVDFEQKIKNILYEIFDPNQGFDHLERDKKCMFCD